MRFADEMRGSIGERCTVSDLRHDCCYYGVVQAWDDEAQKATVKYDDGKVVRVDFGFVQLHGEEKP